MFGWFKNKEEYNITITRSGKDVILSEKRELDFLNKVHVCPECNHLNRPSFARYAGDGKKYKVPMNCRLCRCEWSYNRPYNF